MGCAVSTDNQVYRAVPGHHRALSTISVPSHAARSGFLDISDVMMIPPLCRAFMQFTKLRHAEENLTFMIDVHAYRAQPTWELATYIYQRYIDTASPLGVNLPHSIIDSLSKRFNHGCIMNAEKQVDGIRNAPLLGTEFDESVRAIDDLLSSDLLPTFLGTRPYHVSTRKRKPVSVAAPAPDSPENATNNKAGAGL